MKDSSAVILSMWPRFVFQKCNLAKNFWYVMSFPMLWHTLKIPHATDIFFFWLVVSSASDYAWLCSLEPCSQEKYHCRDQMSEQSRQFTAIRKQKVRQRGKDHNSPSMEHINDWASFYSVFICSLRLFVSWLPRLK